MKQTTAHLKPKPRGKKAAWGPNDPPVFTAKTIYTIAPKPPSVVTHTNTHSL